MNNEPLVSCIIPTYNRGEKVGRAIKSILSQTYTNLELLVVDDQSVDNTKEIVKDLAKTDFRIKYLLNPKKGANNARNFGIINARGQYISFLDDDDIWLSSKLEKQLNVFQKLGEKYGLVFCPFVIKKSNGKTSEGRPSRFSIIRNGDMLNRLLKRNFITTSTIFVKSEVFQKCGMFAPRYKSYQDWELLTRIARQYFFYYLKEPLVIAFESDDSITRDKKGRVLTSLMHLKQNMELYEKNHSLLSFRYCAIGFTLLKLKRYKAAKRFIYRSLKYNKLNFEAIFYLFFLMVRSIFVK